MDVLCMLDLRTGKQHFTLFHLLSTHSHILNAQGFFGCFVYMYKIR